METDSCNKTIESLTTENEMLKQRIEELERELNEIHNNNGMEMRTEYDDETGFLNSKECEEWNRAYDKSIASIHYDTEVAENDINTLDDTIIGCIKQSQSEVI